MDAKALGRLIVNTRTHAGEGVNVYVTYGRHPRFASTAYARPIIVADLGPAFLVGTDDLPGELSTCERGLHPFHLVPSVRAPGERKG